jgi:4-amino-4-deoxy-L-arabinose transferase-like glycosyltransferase
MLTPLAAALRVHRLFTAILIGYVALAVGFSLANPIYESTDELHHFRYIRYLQQYGALPEQRFDQPRIQAHHPPLYYLIAALATSWIVPDHDALYEPATNPYYGYRYWEINNDNKNRYLHGPAEAWPYQGVVLMVHVARWVNVILGAIMVWVTYRIGLAVSSPSKLDAPMAAGAAAIVAFNPQFLFMSGAINNDVIAGLFGSILLWQGVTIARGGLTPRRAIGLAIAFGLALMAKFNLAFALPLIEVAVLIAVWPQRDGRGFIKANVILLIGVALFAGWWFARNTQLYGEPTGVQRMTELWGGRDPRASFWLAVSEMPYAWSSLWGRFGYGQIPLPDAIYTGALIVTVIGLVGLIRAGRRRSFDRHQLKQVALVIFSALLFAAALFGYMLSSTAGPMGRFYFPGLSAFGLLLALGLNEVMQEARGRRQEARGRRQAAGGRRQAAHYAHLPWRAVPGLRITHYAIPIAAFALALIAFFGYFVPAYAAPPMLTAAALKIDQPIKVMFDGQAELLGAEVDRGPAQPGDPIKVTLYWRALAAMDQSYTEFVHLIDGDGILVAQRDTWPGRGLYPTVLWQPGQVFADELTLHVPDGAYAPNVATVQVGLYDAHGTRLAADGANVEDDAAALGQVAIAPRPGGYPNSMRVNFGDRVELLGYAMSPRAILPGEAVTVTLYWRSRAGFEADYAVFLNAIRPSGRKSAEATGRPLGDTLATTRWPVGQVITDVRVLRFPPTAKPGPLDLEVGWFLPGAARLSVLAADGHEADTKQLLSQMRISR